MKLSFKNIFKIAIVLMLVAGLSGALIVLVNKITAPIILENEIKQEQKAQEAIFKGANFTSLAEFSEGDIVKVSKASIDGDAIGYVYRLSGKNAYGVVSILIGINNDGVVSKVVFLENGQSFATKLDAHVNNTYQSLDIDGSNIGDVDVKCGATFGAKLVKRLIQSALDDYNMNYKENGNE